MEHTGGKGRFVSIAPFDLDKNVAVNDKAHQIVISFIGPGYL